MVNIGEGSSVNRAAQAAPSAATAVNAARIQEGLAKVAGASAVLDTVPAKNGDVGASFVYAGK